MPDADCKGKLYFGMFFVWLVCLVVGGGVSTYFSDIWWAVWFGWIFYVCILWCIIEWLVNYCIDRQNRRASELSGGGFNGFRQERHDFFIYYKDVVATTEV